MKEASSQYCPSGATVISKVGDIPVLQPPPHLRTLDEYICFDIIVFQEMPSCKYFLRRLAACERPADLVLPEDVELWLLVSNTSPHCRVKTCFARPHGKPFDVDDFAVIDILKSEICALAPRTTSVIGEVPYE